MGVPSVVRIKNGKIEYTSKVDIANYTMQQLTRRALQDVARFVLFHVRSQVRGINKFTSKGQSIPKRYQSCVLSRENVLLLGVENIKKGAVTAWWADQAELGTNKQPKRAILYNVVTSNIPKIVEIESQYLAYMRDEAAALNAIHDTPEEGFGDDGDE